MVVSGFIKTGAKVQRGQPAFAPGFSAPNPPSQPPGSGHPAYGRYNSNFESVNPNWHAHHQNASSLDLNHNTVVPTPGQTVPLAYSHIPPPRHSYSPAPSVPLSPPPSYTSSPYVPPSTPAARPWMNSSTATVNLTSSVEALQLDAGNGHLYHPNTVSHHNEEDVDGRLQQLVGTKLDEVITCMDEELFSGNEQDLGAHYPFIGSSCYTSITC
jgi:hypothetical protein